MSRRPSRDELEAAADLLWHVAQTHGLSDLRLSEGAGELVATVGTGRTYFDVGAFEDEIDGTLGWKPTVISAGARGARPGAKLTSRSSAA
jgi:hypothetical protein